MRSSDSTAATLHVVEPPRIKEVQSTNPIPEIFMIPFWFELLFLLALPCCSGAEPNLAKSGLAQGRCERLRRFDGLSVPVGCCLSVGSNRRRGGSERPLKKNSRLFLQAAE